MHHQMVGRFMGSMRRVVAAVTVVVLAPLVMIEAGQEPADVAGEWALEVVTDGAGTTTPSVTLEQDGATLSGHYSSATLGEADVMGTVDGNDFRFVLDAELQGQGFEVTYTGTLQEDRTLSGEVDLGGLASGTFTGTRR